MRPAFWLALLFPGIAGALRVVDWLATFPSAFCLPASGILMGGLIGGILYRVSRHA